MRHIPAYPDQPGILPQDFYFTEPPLEHYPEEFYYEMPYGNYLVFEGWWDNPVDCWIQSGHNTSVEVVDTNLPSDFTITTNGLRVTIHRDIKKHLDRYPLKEVKYQIIHDSED